MPLLNDSTVTDWQASLSSESQSEKVKALEEGNILHFAKLPFILLPDETQLLSPNYADPKSKNISYNQNTNILRCAKDCSPEEHKLLKTMLQRFAESAYSLIQAVLPTYIPMLQVGRTSYRPIEIAGRV